MNYNLNYAAMSVKQLRAIQEDCAKQADAVERRLKDELAAVVAKFQAHGVTLDYQPPVEAPKAPVSWVKEKRPKRGGFGVIRPNILSFMAGKNMVTVTAIQYEMAHRHSHAMTYKQVSSHIQSLKSQGKIEYVSRGVYRIVRND